MACSTAGLSSSSSLFPCLPVRSRPFVLPPLYCKWLWTSFLWYVLPCTPAWARTRRRAAGLSLQRAPHDLPCRPTIYVESRRAGRSKPLGASPRVSKQGRHPLHTLAFALPRAQGLRAPQAHALAWTASHTHIPLTLCTRAHARFLSPPTHTGTVLFLCIHPPKPTQPCVSSAWSSPWPWPPLSLRWTLPTPPPTPTWPSRKSPLRAP
jgi:hypothetical protein